MIIIMLGAQGTGKGTVAGLLSKSLKYHKYLQEIFLEKILVKKHL